MPQFLSAHGRKLAYEHHAGKSPGVIFLGGFRSDMTGSKATALAEWARKNKRQFTRLDYSGHGQSSGKFEEGTIGRWLEDALAVLDKATKGPQLLVGSSMGGWLMLLVALMRPKRVAGLVGIASAPDFTERLIYDAWTAKQRQALKAKGRVNIKACPGEPDYVITKALIEDARDYLVLEGEIPITCPVHLIHGMQDKDVPWEFSLSLNEKLHSKDVKMTLLEGDHRLSDPKNLAAILRIVDKMVAKLEAK